MSIFGPTPRRALVVGCISAVASYAVYDAGTEEMIGYSEEVWPEAGEMVRVSLDPRGRRLDPVIDVLALGVDRSAWD